jgi:hypothetical protein
MTRVYEYDVFISYQRGGTVPAWVRTHFYPRLSELLDDELTHEVRVFFDENVQPGGKWPQVLRTALQRTRILVAVCSPKYFQSEWCLAEWHSMARREEMVGTAARSLIYPVIYSDSRNFPTYAHERRMLNFRDYNLPAPQFQDSPGYLDFYREVRRMAEELGELVEKAPEWRADWPVDTPLPEPPPTSSLPRF